MAKNIRKIMAMFLAVCMLLSVLPLQALAAEESTTTNVGNLTVTITPSEGSEGNSVSDMTVTGETENGTTVNLEGVRTETTVTDSATHTTTNTVDVALSGKETDGEIEKDVTYQETVVTNTVTNAAGQFLSEEVSTTGSETKEWYEEDVGDGEQPEVVAPVVPGETTTAEGGVVTETVTNPDGSTTTTTTDRTVTVVTGEAEVTINDASTGLVDEAEAVLNGPAPVYDETDGPVKDAAGKEGVFDRNYLSSQTMDKVILGDIVIWIDDSNQVISNIYIPEGAEVPEDFSYSVGDSVKSWYSGSNPSAKLVPAGAVIKNNLKLNDINQWYDGEELIFDIPEGGDFMYVGTGEHSLYFNAYVTVTYQKDADGNTLYDEEGNAIIESITTSNGTVVTIDGVPAKELPDEVTLKPLYDNYNGSRAMNFMLMDKNGNRVYVYCCDMDTGAVEGIWYNVKNLEDSDYFASEESENHIRNIALNGYWGTSDIPAEDGSYERGSLESIKEKLRAAIHNGEMENEVVELTVTDADGNETVISKTMLELIDELTEGEALLATQSAIWSYSNGSYAVRNGKDGQIVIDPDGYKWNQAPGNSKVSGGVDLGTINDFGSARIDFLYKWLISLEEETSSTTVVNGQNFLEDVSITIHDKAVDENGEALEANTDGNHENDVYNTDLNLKLAFVPGANDDLLVQVSYIDYEGNEQVIIRRLAGTQTDYEKVEYNEEDGSYVLRGLKLSENEDFAFDLRLEGTQYLEDGVYLYQAVGGRGVSQTFVGIAEGTKNVDVSVGFTIQFDVDENNHVVVNRSWTDVYDPTADYNDPNPPEEPQEEPEEPWNPPQNHRLANDAIEIPEEPVPLAVPVKTGDSTGLWIAFAMAVAFAMVAINLSDKKRNYETF